MSVYFISDLHFGVINMLKARTCFKTVQEMDRVMVQNWNEKVSEHDTVYILGDVVGRNICDFEKYVSMLKGKKYLVIGNHDVPWINSADEVEKKKLFAGISHYLELEMDGKLLTLCHYPMLEWNNSRKNENSYLLHGHIHTRTQIASYNIIKCNLERALNCTPEINHYEPVTINELILNNKKWYGRF